MCYRCVCTFFSIRNYLIAILILNSSLYSSIFAKNVVFTVLCIGGASLVCSLLVYLIGQELIGFVLNIFSVISYCVPAQFRFE